MSKILVVVALGGIALALFLVLQRRASDAPAASAVTSATQSPQAVSSPVATVTAAAAVPPPASTTDAAACAHLSDLCSTTDHPMEGASCEKQLVDARKMAGESNVVRTEQCIAEAKTCAAAQGCISGGVGMGAMGEFLKGLGSAMSH